MDSGGRSRRPMPPKLKAMETHWISDKCDSGTIRYISEYVQGRNKIGIYQCLLCDKEIHVRI